MSTPKFTPGPWKAHHGWAEAWVDIDRAKYPNWCEVTGPSMDCDPTLPYNKLSISGHIGLANAHLIAAAPEMYEALMAASAFLQSRNGCDPQSALKAMHAAIDKADGLKP